MILATINSSASPKSSSSATELEAPEEELLLESDDSASLVSSGTVGEADMEDEIPSKTGSIVASLKGKRAICIVDRAFETSPMSPLVLEWASVTHGAKESQICDLFGPAISVCFAMLIGLLCHHDCKVACYLCDDGPANDVALL